MNGRGVRERSRSGLRLLPTSGRRHGAGPFFALAPVSGPGRDAAIRALAERARTRRRVTVVTRFRAHRCATGLPCRASSRAAWQPCSLRCAWLAAWLRIASLRAGIPCAGPLPAQPSVLTSDIETLSVCLPIMANPRLRASRRGGDRVAGSPIRMVAGAPCESGLLRGPNHSPPQGLDPRVAGICRGEVSPGGTERNPDQGGHHD